MKRNWNWAVWTGASLVFLGVISCPLFFVRFPALRDFPWANLPMIALGLVLLALGLCARIPAFGPVSRQNFRQCPRCASVGIQRIFPLRHFYRRAACATPFARRAAGGPDGARFHAAGFAEPPSEFNRCVEFSVHSRENNPRRDERGQGSRRDFDFLPWILVTVLQLRVTEFRAGAAGIRCKENWSDGHQCGFSRGFRKPASVAGLHVSDSIGCTGGRDSQVGSGAPSRPARRCRHFATSGIPYRPVGEGALGESYGRFRGPRPARRGARSV